jgi:hypothetical protein
MMTLTITRTARVQLSADEWQLYSSQPDCDLAATALNHAAEVAIGSSDSIDEAMNKWMPYARAHREFGATDSEPYWVAIDLFRRAFKE